MADNEDAEAEFERQDDVIDVNQVSNFRNDFDETIKSFSNMNIPFDEITDILKICCSILFMGNVKFTSNHNNESEVDASSSRWIKKFIKVLNVKGIDETSIKKTLTT